MNPFILDSQGKPVNLLLGALDESFGWDASQKLLAVDQGNIGFVLVRARSFGTKVQDDRVKSKGVSS